MEGLKTRQYMTVIVGPPKDETKDEEVVKSFMSHQGKKIVCGGTSANIVARVLKQNVKTHIATATSKVPPIGSIPGIDLVTEGQLTIRAAIEILNEVHQTGNTSLLEGGHGGAILAKMLYNEKDEICLIIGEAINRAHHEIEGISKSKRKLIAELEEVLCRCGKTVTKLHF